MHDCTSNLVKPNGFSQQRTEVKLRVLMADTSIRTVARKLSIREVTFVQGGGLTFEFNKNYTDLQCFIF